MAFSPDGTTAASASHDGNIRFWDVATGRQLPDMLATGDRRVWSVAYSPDGTTLASADGVSVRLWDEATHQARGDPLLQDGEVVSVAFSPDGAALASACVFDYVGYVVLWDLTTPQPVGTQLEQGPGRSYSVAFSPNGKLLAAGGAGLAARLWDIQTREPVGQLLTGTSVVPLDPISPHDDPDGIYGLAFSPDSSLLVGGSLDRTVRVWSTADTLQSPSVSHSSALRFGHADAVNAIAFSPDGTFVSGSSDGTVGLWSANALNRPLSTPLPGTTNSHIQSVAFSPNSKLLASGGDSPVVRLWEVAAHKAFGKPLQQAGGHVTSVAVGTGGSVVAAGSKDGTVRLWDVSASESPVVLLDDKKPVSNVAFSPDGKRIAAGAGDVVHLWDVASRQPLAELVAGQSSPVASVAFSSDGKTLTSTAEDGTLRFWEVATGKQSGDPEVGPLGKGIFSPDGQILAWANSDTRVHLWSVSSQHDLGAPLAGHTMAVQSMAFSPDERTLASGARDKEVRLWDVASGQLLGVPLLGHEGSVTSVTFSPNGRFLASASDYGSLRLWDMALDTWVAHSCQVANRNLSLAEWTAAMGATVAYRRTCHDLPPGEGAPPDTP